MTIGLHRKFISLIAGASILITGFAAAPARAGDDDVARALAAIVGIAIIGAAINDSRRDDRTQPVIRHGRHVEPRPLPRRVHRKLLPRHCLRTYSSRRSGDFTAFGRKCLRNNYAQTKSLPQNCLREVRAKRGRHFAYGARCLRNQGYRSARY